MGAIGALSTAAGALRRNPGIVLGVLAISAIGSIGTVGQVFGGTILVVVGSIVGFLLQPFLLGGVLGMAEEGVGGRASIGTILRAGAANYLTLLGATIVEIVLLGAIGIVWAIVVAVVLVGGGLASGGVGGAGGALGLGLGLGVVALILVSILAFLLLVYFIQFYDVAVVVDDTGSWEAFKRSYAVVRRNLLSVLGYTLIAQAINLVVLVPTFWLLFSDLGGFDSGTAAGGGGMAGGGMAGGALGSATLADVAPQLAIALVLGTLVSSFLITYRVAYYGDVTRERTASTDGVESQTAD